MKKELLFSITKKDFEITYFSGTGKGGQHRNRHKNCVRLKHKETGIITTGQAQRSLEQNKKEAFNSMINNKKFKLWLKIKISKATEDKEEIKKQINQKVNEMMDEKFLKIEYGDKNEK